MHKKANLLENLFIFAFYLIIAVVIYLSITKIVSEESFFEDYLVRDVGLTIDALHNSPGNVNVEYRNLKNFNFNFVIKENFIEIKSLVKLVPKIYAFTKDKNYKQLEYDLKLNNKLIINKNKNLIILEAKD